MNKPSVSIIIPVYNVEPYVGRCIESVMNQTYCGALECIVVDDCGVDNSMAIAEKLIYGYIGPISFVILRHAHNRGLSAARNTGIDAASGDYVFFLDSDDALPANSLELLATPIQNDPTIEMVTGNRIHALAGLEPELKINEADFATLKDVRSYFFNHFFSKAAWNKLIQKDFLKRHHLYFKEGLLHEDILWTHYVMQHLSHLYLIPDITYHIYGSPDSITRGLSWDVRAPHLGNVYEEIARNFTIGEEAREAAYYLHYLPRFYYLLRHYPNIATFQRAANLFIQALSDGHHAKEKLLLSLTVFFSKTAIGRGLINAVLGIRRFLRKIIVSLHS